MCVFSTNTALTGTWWWSASSTASFTSEKPSSPRESSTVCHCTEAFIAAAPFSNATTCWERPATTAVPGTPSTRSAIWLPIVPDGTKTAASLPTRSAKVCSRRLTVGSSPEPSSPTSASAIARRIAADGLVTVSERRSTIPLLSVTPASYCRLR